MGECVEVQYIDYLAEKLVKDSMNSTYAYRIRKVCENPTELNFYRRFCKISNTYYFHIDEGFYGAEFDKKNWTVRIYKCGKHPEIILETYKISDVLERFLILAEKAEIFWCEDAGEWCAVTSCHRDKSRPCGWILKSRR